MSKAVLISIQPKWCELIASGKNKIGHKKPSYALVRDGNMKSLSARIYFESFGKTVFLTKDRAEQELKELRE